MSEQPIGAEQTVEDLYEEAEQAFQDMIEGDDEDE